MPCIRTIQGRNGLGLEFGKQGSLRITSCKGRSRFFFCCPYRMESAIHPQTASLPTFNAHLHLQAQYRLYRASSSPFHPADPINDIHDKTHSLQRMVLITHCPQSVELFICRCYSISTLQQVWYGYNASRHDHQFVEAASIAIEYSMKT